MGSAWELLEMCPSWYEQLCVEKLPFGNVTKDVMPAAKATLFQPWKATPEDGHVERRNEMGLQWQPWAAAPALEAPAPNTFACEIIHVFGIHATFSFLKKKENIADQES